MVFLPGIAHPRHIEICALCDKPALYTTVVRLKISDPNTSKSVGTELDMMLCEQHADKIDIQVDKFSRISKKQMMILP